MYDENQHFIEGNEGQYVTMIQQTSRKAVPVVRVIGFSKYLGHLNLTFDDHGELLNFNGRPILLDHALPQGKERLKSRDNKIVWSLLTWPDFFHFLWAVFIPLARTKTSCPRSY